MGVSGSTFLPLVYCVYLVATKVPVTALLKNVDPSYPVMEAKERTAEFRRSVLSNFFAHLWKLVLNLSLESLAQPKVVEKRERQYSHPSWQKSLLDPLQANSLRMVINGGDIGLTVFDNMLSPTQKRMLKSVRYGAGIMFAHNMQLAGNVYKELGYRSYGNFIVAQSPYFGQMVKRWLKKRQTDRVREIFGWLSLALFFTGAVIQ